MGTKPQSRIADCSMVGQVGEYPIPITSCAPVPQYRFEVLVKYIKD